MMGIFLLTKVVEAISFEVCFIGGLAVIFLKILSKYSLNFKIRFSDSTLSLLTIHNSTKIKMKTFLCYLKRAVWGVALLGTVSAVQAQKIKGLKKSPSQNFQPASLYKQSKIYDSKSGATEQKPTAVGDKALDRMVYEFNRLKDPKTGKIPEGIQASEERFSKTIAIGDDMKKSVTNAKKGANKSRFSYWKQRGPYNVGGRTRALAIDRTNEDIIFAGGVSGGLWRSRDAGASWRRVTTLRQSPSVTAIVQDPRPGKHNIWYYGGGERFGNSASDGGAFYQGTGIYKSTNGGFTWKLLEASNDNDVRAFSPLDVINSMVIDPTNGYLYVGTLDGLHRSTDEGKTFEEVLESGFLGTVEVAVTSQGQLYATIRSSADENAGFHTSSNGTDWTAITPSSLPASIGRTVMGVNPSNEDEIYFFAQNTGQDSAAFLLKYDAAKKADSAWVDLSANLPLSLGRVGSLNLQGGYNMLVKVSPANPDMVFIGGTNIYRSLDGFTTPAGQESWVAGYRPDNSVAVYTNQHPDQHALLFYPSNPNKVLSGNDGGVFITEDITAVDGGDIPIEPVGWTSLNNGYFTTQPHHISIDPSENNDGVLAGFQDNGTWFTDTTDQTAFWKEEFGGDGAYSAIADNGRTHYVSSQRGRVYRLNLDEDGNEVSFARVQPNGATGLAFIAPFVLDPNNDNIMYLPAGNRMWRNNNLDSIPIFSNALAKVNWVDLPASDTPEGSVISALGVSKYPVANRLYYGTDKGQLYRIDNANIDDQQPVDIFTGKGLPEGNITDINVDPSNSDRVIVAFSNYRIPSLFLTNNGGETWTNISGNLEENPDGSGNGPSVRSTAFVGSSAGRFGASAQSVYVATSTGLYYTLGLRGERTRWNREPLRIGNAVVEEVVSREDGFIAVGAHGNGTFSAKFPVFNKQPETTLSRTYLLEDLALVENNEPIEVSVAGLFESSIGAPIDIQFINSNEALVTATLENDVIKITIAKDAKGKAAIGLIATSNGEQVSEGFTINVSELPIYEQQEAAISSSPAQFFVDFNAVVSSSDDFTIPENSAWTIERIVADGGANNTPSLDNATVIIYADNAGVPGDEVYNSGAIAPISKPDATNLDLLLPAPVALESGTYWLTVYANLAFGANQQQWFWQSQAAGIGEETHLKDPADLFGTGSVDWTPASVAFGNDPVDQVFQIFGDLKEATATAQVTNEIATQELTTLETKLTSLIWPNPSSDVFTFNLKSLKATKTVSVTILDITGSVVYQQANLASDATFSWDASQLKTGFYFAKIAGDSNITVKLIKQ